MQFWLLYRLSAIVFFFDSRNKATARIFDTNMGACLQDLAEQESIRITRGEGGKSRVAYMGPFKVPRRFENR